MATPFLVGPGARFTDAVPVGGIEPIRLPLPMVAGVARMAVGQTTVLRASTRAPLIPPRRPRPRVGVSLGGDTSEAPGEPREAARVARRG